MMNLNKASDGLALARLMAMSGTKEDVCKKVLAFGPAFDAGSTGLQGSYGWRHHDRITGEQEMSAVVVNYASRGVFYLGEPHRKFGGLAAGRIEGAPRWNVVDGLHFSGIDAEHACYGPLWALIDVTEGLPEWNAPARLLAREHVAALIGQLRHPGLGDPALAVPWTFSDRAAARILETIVEAHERDCIAKEDAVTALHWIRNAFLPFYGSGAGIHEFVKVKKGVAPTYRVGIPNGLGLLIPVLWDATRGKAKGGIPSGPVKVRLRDILKRLCQWVVDLHRFDAEAISSYAFHLSPAHAQRTEESILGYISHVEPPGSTDWRPWMYRAVAVAAQVTGNDRLEEWCAVARGDYGGKPEHRVWMVDPDGEAVA